MAVISDNIWGTVCSLLRLQLRSLPAHPSSVSVPSPPWCGPSPGFSWWNASAHTRSVCVREGDENFLLICQVPLESQVWPNHWTVYRDRDISPPNPNARAGRKSLRLPEQDSPVAHRYDQAAGNPGGATADRSSGCTRKGPPQDASQEEMQEPRRVRGQMCLAEVCRVTPAGWL